MCAADRKNRVYAGLGRKANAIREAKRATEIIPESTDKAMGAGMQENLADIYLQKGELDLAFPILAHSLQTPCDAYANDPRFAPLYDKVRGDPRFQKLMAAREVIVPLDTEVPRNRAP